MKKRSGLIKKYLLHGSDSRQTNSILRTEYQLFTEYIPFVSSFFKDKAGALRTPQLILISFLLSLFVVTWSSAADKSICAPDTTVAYYSDGSLRSCTLNDIYEQGNLKCAANADISFYPDGKIISCVLYEDITVNGIPCGDKGRISFYPSGKVERCTLDKSLVIDGVKCMPDQPVTLFENGRLASCEEAP